MLIAALGLFVLLGASSAVSASARQTRRTQLRRQARGAADRISHVGHAAAYAQQCPEPLSQGRNPANPLGLSTAPGSDPLTGARFFVPGPAHGAAAGAIAQLMGIDPATLPDGESWAAFDHRLHTGALGATLATHPALARQVAELSTIASQPEAQRISSYSWGGGPGGIFKQTEKIFCQNMAADPGSIPIFNTYFLHASLGACPTPAEVRAYDPVFERRVDEMAEAIDHRPAVVLVEVDGVGETACVARQGALRPWEADLRYEINAMAALPHTVVYVEGGYSDANSVGYTARVLNAVGVRRIRGFFTNDTHEAWTIKEVRWANAIAKRTGGAGGSHFIVNTADNGRGPKLNPRPSIQGVEDLCNPPGRGLGPPDTTSTGFPAADAFLWTHPPGNSSGCGDGPPGGVFWPHRAEQEAQRANNRLGPGFPSEPY